MVFVKRGANDILIITIIVIITVIRSTRDGDICYEVAGREY